MNADQLFQNQKRHGETERLKIETFREIAGPKGEIIVTIEKLGKEQFGNDEPKPTLVFRDLDKHLSLTWFGKETLKKLYGDDTDGWIGKRIALYIGQYTKNGTTGEAITIRDSVPTAVPTHAPVERVGQMTDTPPF